MKPFFLTQGELEAWLEQARAVVDGTTLRLAPDNVPHELQPAVRLTRLVAGEDQGGLLGAVRTIAELKSAGADCCAGSVISGETVYECDDGFLCAPTEQPLQRPPASLTEDVREEKTDAELLADFLLKQP